jgi:hypothetical protein
VTFLKLYSSQHLSTYRHFALTSWINFLEFQNVRLKIQLFLRSFFPEWFSATDPLSLSAISDSEDSSPTSLSFFHVVNKLSKFIRHLDISSSSSANIHTFPNPNGLLAKVVDALPALQSLDISGTNLAGTGVAEIEGSTGIPGLNARKGRPLEYLGLYNTHHDACGRDSIPAKNIAGDKDEHQILNAARAFIDRHEVLEKVLNDLFHVFRSELGVENRFFILSLYY